METKCLDYIEINPVGQPSACVIWLHGLGADGNDFAGIVPELRLPQTLNVRFVLPHAPYRPITRNQGHVMRGWYDIAQISVPMREDKAGLDASTELLDILIQQEMQQGIDSRRIILAGFSQGCALALHAGLRYPKPLGGIIALSGYLPLTSTLSRTEHTANAATPIFMAHGDADDVIALPIAELSHKALLDQGYDVAWHLYKMAHSVSVPEISDIAAWIVKTLEAKPAMRIR